MRYGIKDVFAKKWSPNLFLVVSRTPKSYEVKQPVHSKSSSWDVGVAECLNGWWLFCPSSSSSHCRVSFDAKIYERLFPSEAWICTANYSATGSLHFIIFCVQVKYLVLGWHFRKGNRIVSWQANSSYGLYWLCSHRLILYVWLCSNVGLIRGFPSYPDCEKKKTSWL